MRTYYLHARHKHTYHAAAFTSIPRGRGAKGQLPPPTVRRCNPELYINPIRSVNVGVLITKMARNFTEGKVSAETSDTWKARRQAATS